GVVLAGRPARWWQGERGFGRQRARGGALAAPSGWPPSRGPRDGGPGTTTVPRPGAGTRPGGGTGPGGRRPRGNGRTPAAEAVRAQYAADGPPAPPGPRAPPDRAPRPPEITGDEALGELGHKSGPTPGQGPVPPGPPPPRG